jgi:hypothetical protein
MELDEAAVARRHLGLAAASYRGHVDERRPGVGPDDEDGWDAWVARLEADAALAGPSTRAGGAERPEDERPPGAHEVP